MPLAIVGSAEVTWSQICTHWTGWQKPSGPVLSFQLELSHSEVITKFGKFWSEFNGRESEGDGMDIQPGLYSSLQSLGYPSLQAMLSMHTQLFEKLVLEELQTEFFRVPCWSANSNQNRITRLLSTLASLREGV
jgi:hypothetical protein